MKISIIGNVATIVAEGLDFDAMKAMFKDGVKLHDEIGNQTYLASTKNVGSVGIVGCAFNGANSEGDALIQIEYSGDKKKFATANADGLKALEDNLPKVIEIVNARRIFLEDIEAKITVE